MARKAIAAALSLTLLAGCSATRQREPIATPKIDSPKVAQGEKAYMQFCDKCHPGGDKGLGPAIRNKPLPGFLIKTQVRTGMGAMPAFSNELLPEEHLDDLVAYIKQLRKQQARDQPPRRYCPRNTVSSISHIYISRTTRLIGIDKTASGFLTPITC